VLVKDGDAIRAMRRAGRIVAEMHDVCREAARPGVTTAFLERLCADVLERRGADSNFLGYPGVDFDFPGVICASPNEVVVHGLPGERVLEDGDIVAVDAGAVLDGWHADAAVTIPVGRVSDEIARFLAAGEGALHAGITAAVAGNRIGDISAAVQNAAESRGYSVVAEYVGHGIGLAMHEDPQVPNVGEAGRGPRLRNGMCLAVEPILCTASPVTTVLADNWTVVTSDGGWACHFEHSLAITPDGPQILTLP